MRKTIMAAGICALALTAGCNNNGGKTNDNGQTTTENAAIEPRTEAMIAYINIDSLLLSYDMYKELQGEFEAKAQKASDNLNARGSRLQKDIADFQEKVEKVLITRAQATEMEADLTKRQQDFMQYSNKIQSELAEEEAVMMNRIRHSITEYVREFNKDYRYSMILSSSESAGPVLDADPSLNITKIILDALNKRHAESKK